MRWVAPSVMTSSSRRTWLRKLPLSVTPLICADGPQTFALAAQRQTVVTAHQRRSAKAPQRGRQSPAGLKNRPTEDVRRVPIPPQLVTMLRDHLATFGTAEDGRLFFSESARSSRPRPTTACGRRLGSWRFRRPLRPRHSPVGRTTFGTRRYRRGSTQEPTRPRLPSAPATALRSC